MLGGAAVSEPLWPGYTVSGASYVCTLLDPWLIAELDLKRHGYHAYRKDPAIFNVLRDGRSLLLGADDSANEREIASFNRADVEGMREADSALRRLGSELFETFSDEQPQFARFSPRTQELLLGSAAGFIEHYVDTPVLQAAVATDGIIGTYLGPRDPRTGYVLAHHYAGRALGVQGAWGYVRGGMGAISNALSSAARSYGAEIFSESNIEHIVVHGNTATGIVLADGREVGALSVASNAHPRTTFLKLLPEGPFEPAFLEKVRSWKSTGCSLAINLALGELPNFLSRPGTVTRAHHRARIHVAPSIDCLQNAFHDARRDGFSKAALLECFFQTPTDASLALAGKHILSLFAQYYDYDASASWNATQVDRLVSEAIELLAVFAPNFPAAIEARQILTPVDLKNRFGLVGGHIRHGELLPGQIYEDRFDTQTPIRNLYLCGSGANPGGCVSGFPGKRAAAAVLRDVKEAAYL